MKINKTLFVLAAATSITLATAPAYAESLKTETKVERDADGDYTKKSITKGTDASGTATSDESEVKVDVDSDGSYKKTYESKSIKDPKGAMNKSVIKASETTKSDNGKYEDKTSVETKNGVTGTKTSREGTVKVKTDDAGNVTEKSLETKVTTDPKGLLNKKTENTVDKMEKNSDESKYRYTKKVNGKTVEDKTLESK